MTPLKLSRNRTYYVQANGTVYDRRARSGYNVTAAWLSKLVKLSRPRPKRGHLLVWNSPRTVVFYPSYLMIGCRRFTYADLARAYRLSRAALNRKPKRKIKPRK